MRKFLGKCGFLGVSDPDISNGRQGKDLNQPNRKDRWGCAHMVRLLTIKVFCIFCLFRMWLWCWENAGANHEHGHAREQ